MNRGFKNPWLCAAFVVSAFYVAVVLLGPLVIEVMSHREGPPVLNTDAPIIGMRLDDAPPVRAVEGGAH